MQMKSALPVAAAISVLALASDANAASIKDVFAPFKEVLTWALMIGVVSVIVALIWRFANEVQSRGSEAIFSSGIMMLLGLLFLAGIIAYVFELMSSLTTLTLFPGL